MGRELMRVPLDFSWPMKRPWSGYLNKAAGRTRECSCEGRGLAPVALHLFNLWYGYLPFKPEDRGGTSYTPSSPAVQAVAQRNVSRSPEFFGSDAAAIEREATRLCALYNAKWSCHLNEMDVKALLDNRRLMDLTHSWTPDAGWQPLVPAVVPTPQEVNDWNVTTVGHDSCNAFACIKAECRLLGAVYECPHCKGEGRIWNSPEDQAEAEAWERTPPPTGEGYQMWETVTAGSPTSPVFSTPRDLAAWLVANRHGTVDENTSVEQWMEFIEGPGWAPSAMGTAHGVTSGVEALTS